MTGVGRRYDFFAGLSWFTGWQVSLVQNGITMSGLRQWRWVSADAQQFQINVDGTCEISEHRPGPLSCYAVSLKCFPINIDNGWLPAGIWRCKIILKFIWLDDFSKFWKPRDHIWRQTSKRLHNPKVRLGHLSAASHIQSQNNEVRDILESGLDQYIEMHLSWSKEMGTLARWN